MPADEIYAATRRSTRSATVTQNTGGTYNKDTMVTTPTENTAAIRWVVQESTRYSRILRATATQMRVGEVSFIFWAKDLTRAGLSLKFDTEDRIVDDTGVEHRVVTSEQFKTGVLVTASELKQP